MNAQRNVCFLAIIGLITITGCQSSDDYAQESEAENATEEYATAKAEGVVHFYIEHEVSDFDVWKAAYDDHSEARAEAGLSDEIVLRDIDNPNLVHVIGMAENAAGATTFFTDPDLAEVMSAAGVLGESLMISMPVVVENESETEFSHIMLLSHEVENFEIWLEGFNAHADMRDAAGLTDIVVTHDLENPRVAYLRFGVSDLEAARAFLADYALAEVMAEAGVTSEPKVSFTTVQD